MSEPVPDCEPPLLAQVSSIWMMPLPVLVGLGERERVFSLECRASSVTVFTLCYNTPWRLIDEHRELKVNWLLPRGARGARIGV